MLSDSSDGEGTQSEVPEVKFLTVEQAINESGGFGLYQFINVPLIGVAFILNGFFMYNLNFMTLLPTLM